MQQKNPIFPESEDTFFGALKDVGQFKISFLRDENGKIAHVRRNIGFRSMLFDKVK